jgi:hypothetical protein
MLKVIYIPEDEQWIFIDKIVSFRFEDGEIIFDGTKNNIGFKSLPKVVYIRMVGDRGEMRTTSTVTIERLALITGGQA